MKKFIVLISVLFFCLAISSVSMAQPKAPAPEKAPPAKAEPPAPEKAVSAQPKPPSPEKAAKPEAAKPEAPKEAEKPKPKSYPGIVGTVEKVESGLITLKTAKGILTFDISKANFKGYKKAEDIKIGDKVWATSIKGVMTIGKIKGAKPEAKKQEKK